jgi:predicted ATPase
METLSVRGVRCFGERQDLPIRPVTLLVGENSAGKSTILAMVRAAWDIAHRRTEPDFNEEPFDLGGYDAIAYYHGGQGKRARDFLIEASFLDRRSRSSTSTYRIAGTFIERAGQPVLAEWEVERGGMKLRIRRSDETFRIVIQRGDHILLDERDVGLPRGVTLDQLAFLSLRLRASPRRDDRLPTDKMQRLLFELLEDGISRRDPRPIAGAPIRSKPIRTYDPKRETQEPEGSHVPMELATLHDASPEEFEGLASQLATYGKDANLFSKLQVKRLGKKVGDPFQLLIAADRYPFNLRDVGYGVSQVLPILVDTLTAPKGQTFLLQQPEVHLHPRAQAALGSLLVEQAARRGQTFVVETHSDHLVDRVRMDIRDGRSTLKAKDVVILYFERQGGQATVHPITIDKQGNLVDVPKGYRRFFLEEERRLLGI